MSCKQLTLLCNLKINLKVRYKNVSHGFCKIIRKPYEMVRVKYVIVFWYAIGNILFYCASIQFQNQNLYGSMTNAYPKSSCLRINNIHLVIHCLQTCMTNVGIYFISSYNRKQQACLCCSDYSGSDITDPSWNTYEMSKYSPILSFPFQRWFFVQGGGGRVGWVGWL